MDHGVCAADHCGEQRESKQVEPGRSGHFHLPGGLELKRRSVALAGKHCHQVVAWMESNPQVERYAWHDSKAGTSCLYDSAGGLSATGLAYAAAG